MCGGNTSYRMRRGEVHGGQARGREEMCEETI